MRDSRVSARLVCVCVHTLAHLRGHSEAVRRAMINHSVEARARELPLPPPPPPPLPFGADRGRARSLAGGTDEMMYGGALTGARASPINNN